jgi:hypothetical protein
MKSFATAILAITAAVFGIQAQAQSLPTTPVPAPGLSVGEAQPMTPPAPGARPGRHGDHRSMISRIDLDKDGAISRNELLAAQQKQLQAFDAADANRDGLLSREEMQTFQQQLRGARPRS